MQVLLFDFGRVDDDRNVSAARYAQIGVCREIVLLLARKSMKMAGFAAVRQRRRGGRDGGN
jgi:hypothetical protein